MTRHKRRRELTAAEIANIVEQARAFHMALCGHMRALKPQDLTYRQLLALDMAIEDMLRELTGDDPSWCQIAPGFMAGT